MSLPPGFLDELRERVSLAAVVGKRVQWDLRKSNQSRGDMWAPCPFHQEKSASFHVLDKDGYYYCFGCQAKGDAITFLREQDGMGFMEAVEALASEAGMEMPARDPRAAQRQDRRAQLSEILEGAVRHFRMMLRSGAGQGARDYLASRGLSQADIDRFEIGYAPDARQGILAHLTKGGASEADVIEAGLAARPERGEAYDRFRDRIVFPIRDARGRAISLGGRAMSAEAKAKYLNGPETALFDKGRSLYNHRPAREAAAKGAQVVLAEGYMDVIALVRGGVEAACAPLGTAVTEEQLSLLWRMHPEPVVALDGDAAGLRAAMRLVQLALPLVEPGRSLHFAMLPSGQDPDDLLRDGGPEALRAALADPVPLVEMLWRRETAARDMSTPERRAALDASLRTALKAIPDRGLRRHYAEAISERRAALFGTQAQMRGEARGEARAPRGSGQRRQPARLGGPAPLTKTSALAEGGARRRRQREAMVLALAIRHPALVEEFEDALMRLSFEGEHAEILAAIVETGGERAACEARLAPGALDALMARPHLRPVSALGRDAAASGARAFLAAEIAQLSFEEMRAREIEEARSDISELPGAVVDERLRQLSAASDRVFRPAEAGADVVTAENGARIDPREKGALDALAEAIDYGRGGKRPRRR